MKRTLIAALAVATLVSPAVASPYGPFHGDTIGLDQSTPSTVQSPTAKAMFTKAHSSDRSDTLGQNVKYQPSQHETPAARAMFKALDNSFDS